jgi:YVTN family beta-propeller protein
MALPTRNRTLTLLKIVLGAAVLVCGVVLSPRPSVHAQAAAFANFEGSQTNPIRLSADGTRLFAVNTPNGTLSVFDLTVPATPQLIAEIPVGVEPVSVNPLTDDQAWVVNQVSNSISIVSVSKGMVVATLQAKPEPMDVVFAEGLAYVSVSRANKVLVFNPKTLAQVAAIPLLGGSPRALAVSPDKTKVYAAFAISGNGTTIIPNTLAPPPSAPTNKSLPAPPQVGLIVKWNDPNWSQDIKYTMPDHDVAIIKTGSAPSLAGYYSGVGTINLGIAVNPATGDIYVSNTDALNLTQFQPNLMGHFVNNRITKIQKSTGAITPYDLNPGINYSILPNPAALATALAQPTSLVVDPAGTFLWVAAFGTDRVAKVSTSGNVLATIEVAQPSGQGSNVDPANKRGPRGLALDSAAKKLYVLNRITNSISIVDTSQLAVLSEIPIGFNPTPAAIQQGRGFLYDAKLSGNGTGSCASCHVDGDMDHLAWDLGDPGGSILSETETTILGNITLQFHPMKGPMTTLALRGLLNLAPYHWRGEQANLQTFNSTFSALLGGAQLSSSNMNLYANFIDTILYLPNPFENVDRTLSTSLAAANGGNPAQGKLDFNNVAETKAAGLAFTCNDCHTASPSGPGTNLLILPFVPTVTTQPMKIPQLRNVYQKLLFNPAGADIDGFGLEHDGAAANLTTFLQAAPFVGYTAQQLKDIYAYCLQFDTGTAPAVGFTHTLTSANVASVVSQSDWTMLQSQAALGNINLVARGTLSGQLHGLLYQPSTGTYISDASILYTQAQIESLVQAGDTLSIMGVYPGTGSAAVSTIRH